MSESVYAGLTSQTIDVFLTSSTTGGGLTDLAYNTSGLTCYYRKGATGSATSISLATQTVGGAWSSGGFVQVDSTNMPGIYRFDIPNAVVDSEGFATVYFQGAADLVQTPLRVDCRPLPSDVKKIQADAQSATDLKDFADAGYDPATNKVQGVVLVDTTTTNTDMRGTDSAFLAANAPTNFSDLVITATTGRVNVGLVLDTALTQTSSGNLADNISFFYDLDTTTTKTVDDVGGGSGLDAAGVRAAIGMASANLDTQLDALPTTSEVNTQVDTALSDIGLDHLLAAAVTGTDITDNSIIAKLVSGNPTTADWDHYDNSVGALSVIGPTVSTANSTINDIDTVTEDIQTTVNATATAVGGLNDFDPANDTVAHVTLVDTVTENTDMRGTDSALLASSAPTNFGDLAITETTGKVTVGTNDDKTGYSSSGTITTLDALNTAQNTQHSTTQSAISGLNDFDPANDTVAHVTLVDTTTENTDMRGTDSALLASSAPTNFSDLAITETTGRVTVGTNNDKTGYFMSGTITTLDVLNTSQNSQHSTTQAAVGVVDDNVDAIKVTTDQISFGVAGQVDVNVESINQSAVNGTGASDDKWRGS